ncbi:nucleotide exchange factor GrpE [Candidatus Gracilibacteria bacterium]|nr:nucleotide exchange factor GrpE [Candidatus Gracilibacteria bacterium]
MTKKDDHTNDEEIDLAAKVEEAKAEDDVQNSEVDETEKLRQDLQEMTEAAKRTMADMQNMKRRQEEQRSELVQMANAALMKSLIPIIDNLNRAAEHITDDGLVMCLKNFDTALRDAGLQTIETLGQTFNPDIHEAVQSGPGEKDTVIEEYEKGYTLGKRVVKHAKVMVGNGE